MTDNTIDDTYEDEAEEAPKLKVLHFKTEELTPPKVDDILVPLGGVEYVAHCPNDYEFAGILRAANILEEDPANVDIIGFVRSFFDFPVAKEIDRRCRGSRPEISFNGQLVPSLLSLTDHYIGGIEKRSKDAQRKLAAGPKDHQKSRKAGQIK